MINENYIIKEGCMTIIGYDLFDKLRNFFSLEIIGYSCAYDSLYLFCDYSKEQIIEIKKFFYDNYPCSKIIEPKEFGFEIFFTMNVKIDYNLFSLSLN